MARFLSFSLAKSMVALPSSCSGRFDTLMRSIFKMLPSFSNASYGSTPIGKGFDCGGLLRLLKMSGLLYSTVPNDPDTHEDFKPTSKIESSGLSLSELVQQDVKENPVMIYMKGVPNLPQCGFSSLAVRVLKHYNVPLSARNILENPELKSAVKAFSHWPTFPQIFIKGEFIGGSDIILNMHQSGELKDKLKDIASNQE